MLHLIILEVELFDVLYILTGSLLSVSRLLLFDVIGIRDVRRVHLYLNFWSNKEIVAESWVEVSDLPISPAPFDRGQAAQGPDDYLRLLREAQRESNQSSALVSLASTRKNSPHSSWVELFKNTLITILILNESIVLEQSKIATKQSQYRARSWRRRIERILHQLLLQSIILYLFSSFFFKLLKVTFILF